LKPEERSKSKERAEAEKAKNKEQIEYTPTHFVGRVKTGALRLPIYDRIDAKRQNALNQGFPFESLEAEMNEAVREAAREMKKSFRATADQPSTVDPPTQKRTPFDGIQISALVGNNAAKAQVSSTGCSPGSDGGGTSFHLSREFFRDFEKRKHLGLLTR